MAPPIHFHRSPHNLIHIWQPNTLGDGPNYYSSFQSRSCAAKNRDSCRRRSHICTAVFIYFTCNMSIDVFEKSGRGCWEVKTRIHLVGHIRREKGKRSIFQSDYCYHYLFCSKKKKFSNTYLAKTNICCTSWLPSPSLSPSAAHSKHSGLEQNSGLLGGIVYMSVCVRVCVYSALHASINSGPLTRLLSFIPWCFVSVSISAFYCSGWQIWIMSELGALKCSTGVAECGENAW